jgi:hypothetical protein
MRREGRDLAEMIRISHISLFPSWRDIVEEPRSIYAPPSEPYERKRIERRDGEGEQVKESVRCRVHID